MIGYVSMRNMIRICCFCPAGREVGTGRKEQLRPKWKNLRKGKQHNVSSSFTRAPLASLHFAHYCNMLHPSRVLTRMFDIVRAKLPTIS